MSTNPYDEILKRAGELSSADLLRLSEELSQQAGRKRNGTHPTLMDLEGLGKEVWRDVDPDAHIAKERESWDG